MGLRDEIKAALYQFEPPPPRVRSDLDDLKFVVMAPKNPETDARPYVVAQWQPTAPVWNAFGARASTSNLFDPNGPPNLLKLEWIVALVLQRFEIDHGIEPILEPHTSIRVEQAALSAVGGELPAARAFVERWLRDLDHGQIVHTNPNL